MNWISFSDAKPAIEPKRKIHVKYKGVPFMVDTDHLEDFSEATDWCEIEPAKPDSFEEWLWRDGHTTFNADEIAAAKAGWDAAMKHKEGK